MNANSIEKDRPPETRRVARYIALSYKIDEGIKTYMCFMRLFEYKKK